MDKSLCSHAFKAQLGLIYVHSCLISFYLFEHDYAQAGEAWFKDKNIFHYFVFTQSKSMPQF